MNRATRASLRQALSAWSNRVEFKGRARLFRALHRLVMPSVHPTECVLPDGSRLWLDLSDPLHSDIFYGLHEPQVRRWMNALLTRGAVVFDLGAHVGCYTRLAAQKVGTTGVVHAFEPVAANWRLLEQSVVVNRWTQVRVNRAAVSDVSGRVELYVPAQRSHNASGSASIHPLFDETRVEAVNAIVLDDYMEANGITQIDFIKMDIEAAEVRALRGLRRTLQRLALPRILTEVNQGALRGAGYDPNILYTLLEQYHYQPYRIAGQVLRRVESRSRASEIENVIFFPPHDAVTQGAPRVITVEACKSEQ